MAKKLKPALKIKVKGDTWTIYLMSESKLAKHFGKEVDAGVDYEHSASKPKRWRHIYFSRRTLRFSVVIHELAHAHWSYKPYVNRRMKFETAEEHFCQFLERHAIILVRQATTVLKKLRAVRHASAQ